MILHKLNLSISLFACRKELRSKEEELP